MFDLDFDFEFVLLMSDGVLYAREFAKAFGTVKAAALQELNAQTIRRRGEHFTVDFDGKQSVPVDLGGTVVLERQISLRVRQAGDTLHCSDFKGISVKAPFLPLQMTLVECRQQCPDDDGNVASMVKLKKGFMPAITLNLILDREGRARIVRV